MTPASDSRTEAARVLAVDLGARRIGLAVSDPLGITAQGLPSLERGPDPIGQVLGVCREWDVATVVVGLPLNMNGSKGPAAVAAEAFAARLRERGSLAVVTRDERLSTVTAEKVLIDAGLSRKKRRSRGLVDQQAAVVILQTYLDRESRPRM